MLFPPSIDVRVQQVFELTPLLEFITVGKDVDLWPLFFSPNDDYNLGPLHFSIKTRTHPFSCLLQKKKLNNC